MSKFQCLGTAWPPGKEPVFGVTYRLEDGDECPHCQCHVELRHGYLQCQGECKARFHIECDHEKLELLQQVTEYKEDLVVDVMCKGCRLLGSVTIMPDDVMWDRDED